MKKLIFIAAAFFLLPFIAVKGNPAGNPAESQSPSRPAKVSAKSASQSGYISPTPGRFPIIAYSPVTDEKIPTKADFDTLKACGFNCAMTLFNHDEYYDLLGEIKDLGISFIPILDNYTNSRNYDGIKKFITDTRQFMYDKDIAYTIMKRCDMVNHHNHELPTDSLIPIFHPINGSGDVAGTEISNESNTFVTQEIKLKPGGCSIVHYKFRTDERNSGMGKQ